MGVKHATARGACHTRPVAAPQQWTDPSVGLVCKTKV